MKIAVGEGAAELTPDQCYSHSDRLDKWKLCLEGMGRVSSDISNEGKSRVNSNRDFSWPQYLFFTHN